MQGSAVSLDRTADWHSEVRTKWSILHHIVNCFSTSLLLPGFSVDHSGLKAFKDANGMPFSVARIVPFLGSPFEALVAEIFGGWMLLVWILLLTITRHVELASLLICRGKSLPPQVAKVETRRRLPTKLFEIAPLAQRSRFVAFVQLCSVAQQ
jgi:hypothetical protein